MAACSSTLCATTLSWASTYVACLRPACVEHRWCFGTRRLRAWRFGSQGKGAHTSPGVRDGKLEQGLRDSWRAVIRQSDLAEHLLGATNRSIITILNAWRVAGLVSGMTPLGRNLRYAGKLICGSWPIPRLAEGIGLATVSWRGESLGSNGLV